MLRFAMAGLIAVWCTSCASSKTSPEAPPPDADSDLEARMARYATPVLTSDVSQLPDSEKRAMALIIEAARDLDPIFDRQAWSGNPALVAALKADPSPEAGARLRYLRLMRGPWDRQDHHAPILVDTERPPGGGFYPEDLTAEQLEAWIAAHPDDRAELESLFTLVRRDDAGDLHGVPYSEAFGEWLVPAAEKLREAAAVTTNESLATFLESRAAAFLSDDYYDSDKDWMDLDSAVEVTIGPYEVYEDQLLGLKASFEAFVTVTDPDASDKLAVYKEYLPQMEDHLPVPDEIKAVRGGESPIRVVDLVFTSGDARKSVQTIAFNLPNDERVREEKGAKKVLLRNAIETKFEEIMRPIAEQILDPAQMPFLSKEAFFDETLFHELSHSLGPAFVREAGVTTDREVRLALGASYSAIEEGKADVMGAYNVLFMIDRGELPPDFRDKLLVSYFIGLFRSVRFGIAEAHGKGAAVQINWHLKAGAATYDEATGRYSVDLAKLPESITSLVRELCLLQSAGDKARADALLAEYGVTSPSMQRSIDAVASVPVDIRPVFPLAGESGDPLAIDLGGR